MVFNDMVLLVDEFRSMNQVLDWKISYEIIESIGDSLSATQYLRL